jgi:hypothetical protein
MLNEAPYGHGCPPEPVAGKSSKYRTLGPEKREAGGLAVRPGDAVHQKGATVIGMKLQPAHKRGYFVINHKHIALLLAASLIQLYIFKAQLSNSVLFRGSAPGPM